MQRLFAGSPISGLRELGVRESSFAVTGAYGANSDEICGPVKAGERRRVRPRLNVMVGQLLVRDVVGLARGHVAHSTVLLLRVVLLRKHRPGMAIETLRAIKADAF